MARESPGSGDEGVELRGAAIALAPAMAGESPGSGDEGVELGVAAFAAAAGRRRRGRRAEGISARKRPRREGATACTPAASAVHLPADSGQSGSDAEGVSAVPAALALGQSDSEVEGGYALPAAPDLAGDEPSAAAAGAFFPATALETCFQWAFRAWRAAEAQVRHEGRGPLGRVARAFFLSSVAFQEKIGMCRRPWGRYAPGPGPLFSSGPYPS